MTATVELTGRLDRERDEVVGIREVGAGCRQNRAAAGDTGPVDGRWQRVGVVGRRVAQLVQFPLYAASARQLGLGRAGPARRRQTQRPSSIHVRSAILVAPARVLTALTPAVY